MFEEKFASQFITYRRRPPVHETTVLPRPVSTRWTYCPVGLSVNPDVLRLWRFDHKIVLSSTSKYRILFESKVIISRFHHRDSHLPIDDEVCHETGLDSLCECKSLSSEFANYHSSNNLREIPTLCCSNSAVVCSCPFQSPPRWLTGLTITKTKNWRLGAIHHIRSFASTCGLSREHVPMLKHLEKYWSRG